jgi:nucleotide-binding universal stress UspA family protein
MGYRLFIVHALSPAKSSVAYPLARTTARPPPGQPNAQLQLAEDVVADAAASSGVAATGIVEDGLPWDVLENVAEREHGRLLVVAARGLSAARAPWFGSVATRLAASSRRPVVVLPEPGEARIDELYSGSHP